MSVDCKFLGIDSDRLIGDAIKNRVEKMLSNVNVKSSRIMDS